jgi:hypothetical protein
MRGHVVRALGSLEEKADIMARTRGRALWAKEKTLWRTEGWLQHFCPRGLRARIARSLVSAGRARLSESKWDGTRLLVPLWRSKTLAPIYTNLFDDADGGFNRPVPLM